MNDEFLSAASQPDSRSPGTDHTIGSSTLYRLCEEVIALRERTTREHKMFEQKLKETRDALQDKFNLFAKQTQDEYQRLRQQLHGEKRVSLALLNELLEIGSDLEHIVAVRPQPSDAEACVRWAEAIEVESRKVLAGLRRHGVHSCDAVVGDPYDPVRHERVGSEHKEGMDALRIARQVEHGWASQQPEFVLRRPKVIVTE